MFEQEDIERTQLRPLVDNLNFLETLAGILLAPSETTNILFQTRNPPYCWTLFSCILLMIYVPIASQVYKYGYSLTDTGVVLSISLFIFFGLLLFLIIEGLFLQMLKVEFNMQMLFSCVSYSLTPLLLCLTLLYSFNYVTDGRLTFITYLLTGFGTLKGTFLRIIPYAAVISILWVLLVYQYCIRSLAQTSQILSLFVTIVSLLPLALACIAALTIGEIVHPGTSEIITSLLRIPLTTTGM